jgi:SAM-dependent methyltransferase
MKKEWFSTWFDSPYYHILYKSRDEKEAQLLIDNLTNLLKFSPEHRLMDLACGKGRHAIYLNQKDLDVVGLDLSKQSIEHAQQFQNDRLHFYVHDMREIFEERSFDFILNLFTSFGYLESEQENIKAFQSAARSLKKGGVFVMDFFNTSLVISHLIDFQEKEIEGITFKIRKELVDGFILKDIEFTVNDHHYHFQEKVQAITLQHFTQYFQAAGLSLKHLFGNYALAPFSEQSSPRMIFVLEK